MARSASEHLPRCLENNWPSAQIFWNKRKLVRLRDSSFHCPGLPPMNTAALSRSRALRRLLAVGLFLIAALLPLRGQMVMFEAAMEPGRIGHAFELAEPWFGGYAWSLGLGGSGDANAPRWGRLQLELDGRSNPDYAIRDITANEVWTLDPTSAWYDQYASNVTAAFVPVENGVPRKWLLVPAERAGHVFILSQQTGSGVASYPVTIGFGVTEAGDCEAWATYDPAQPFWISDLSAQASASAGAVDLGCATWTSDPSLYPLVGVTVYLDGGEDRHRFTVHSHAPGGPELLASVTAGFHWSTDPLLEFSVGTGVEFWVTRDADGWSTRQNGGAGWIADAAHAMWGEYNGTLVWSEIGRAHV